MPIRRFSALIFDKDGTLIDFDATWNGPIGRLIDDLAAAGADRATVARILGFDEGTQRLASSSPVVAESTAQIADRLALACGRGRGDRRFAAELDEMLEPLLESSVTAAPSADETVRTLAERGVAMAVATNDAAESAQRQIAALGWQDLFDPIVGYDSVARPKPEPDMVRLAQSTLGVAHHEVAMVGDTSTDVLAAQRCGVTAIGVGRAAGDIGADISIGSLADLLDLV